MEAIILAGGLGTRLREVVPDLPKPMAPVEGRPFLEHQMDYWIGQGVSRFVLSVGFRYKAIQRHFGISFNGAKLAYAVEAEPLGTGGGLLLAMGKVETSGPWLVLNGDTFFPVTLAELEQCHYSKRADVTLSLLHIEHNIRYMGVEIDEESRIVKFHAASYGDRQLINGGVYLFSETALLGLAQGTGIRVSLETDIFPELLRLGKHIYGHVARSRLIDIGTPADYARAASVLPKGK